MSLQEVSAAEHRNDGLFSGQRLQCRGTWALGAGVVNYEQFPFSIVFGGLDTNKRRPEISSIAASRECGTETGAHHPAIRRHYFPGGIIFVNAGVTSTRSCCATSLIRERKPPNEIPVHCTQRFIAVRRRQLSLCGNARVTSRTVQGCCLSSKDGGYSIPVRFPPSPICPEKETERQAI